MEKFARQAAQALSQVLGREVTPGQLETPPDPKMGDFAFACFRLAKERKMAPPALAIELATELQKRAATEGWSSDLEIVTAGPYVNFRVTTAVLFGELLREVVDPSAAGAFGSYQGAPRGTWVVEYSSPNVAKPFMISHLRSTALGAALYRMGKLRGFNVVGINHLGDWGTQYGKLAVAHELFGHEMPTEPTIRDWVGIYVRFHEAVATDPTLEDRAREAFRKLESGDPAMTAFWKRCVELSLLEYTKVYDQLGVKFDHIWGESFYHDQLAPMLKDLRARNLLIESEGAWVVPVTDRSGRELPPCILEKKDGSSIYGTRDLAAALYRYEQFNFVRMSYVVGGEQKLHFEQVFSVLRQMGKEWESRCEHIPFGLYRFKQGKMSTRKGNFITFDEVFQECKERVITLMRDRQDQGGGPGFTDAERLQTAEAVALGALVYFDLCNDPVRDVEFDVERVTDFEGETGPYLQYAHTRCLSILRKAADQGVVLSRTWPNPAAARLGNELERQLMQKLGQFPLIVERSAQIAKASALCTYLIELTHNFGHFYKECRILLPSDPELTQGRLLLVQATEKVLAQGLGLLGIPLPQRM